MTFHQRGSSWFLAQLKPNCAHIADRNLKRQGFRTFLPTEDVNRRSNGTPFWALSASNKGSDSLSLIFGGGVVLFSKGNQQHGEEFGRFVPDAGRSGR